MKTFSDRWRQLDWDNIRLRINGKTAADVERALNVSQLTRDDMMALLSPAARLSGTTGPTGAASDPSAIWQRRQLLRPALSFQSLR